MCVCVCVCACVSVCVCVCVCVHVQARDSKGNTPLHYACGYGRVALVTILLEAGADKTAVNDQGSNAYKLAT